MRLTARQPSDHPDEDTLLLLLAGELHTRKALTIRTHLKRCRACRAKEQTLLRGLFAFAKYTRAALLPQAGAPPKGWEEFTDLLEGIASGPEFPEPNGTEAS